MGDTLFFSEYFATATESVIENAQYGYLFADMPMTGKGQRYCRTSHHGIPSNSFVFDCLYTAYILQDPGCKPTLF